MPAARALPSADLMDNMPVLLDRITEITDQLARGNEPEMPPQEADQHARHRLEKGFDLSAVVREYSVLRTCVMRVWLDDGAGISALPLLHQAIDRAIAASADHFA